MNVRLGSLKPSWDWFCAQVEYVVGILNWQTAGLDASVLCSQVIVVGPALLVNNRNYVVKSIIKGVESVAAGMPWGVARGASSLCHCMAGDPPPPSGSGGWRRPTFSSEYGQFLLWCCCYTGQMIYHLDGSLVSSIHTRGLRYGDVFPPPPACHIAPLAWI